VRQLITRIDDDLHARLKARAAEERRSLNSVVTELLEQGLAADDPRARLRARLKAEGRLVEPPPPKGPVPSRDEVIASTRGAWRAVSEALEADRNRR
jgi:plasmid stability protein